MANNESKVLKNNTLEEWRQKTNEISYELGDVDQLDSRLTDKVYTYSSTSESVFSVFDNDAASKNLRFELKPEQVIDAPATIIMTGAPTIPASFVAGKVLFQGSSGSETFTGIINFINVNKISLKNTTGTFNASLPIKFSTDSIAANKLVRLVTESYKIGYVRASQDSVIAYQELRQDGFHIPNLSLRVVLTGSPSIPASFTEGAVVTQANGFSGVLYRATTSELLFKSHSGTFSTTAFAGIPHTDNSNRLAAGNLSSQVTVDNTIGNIIEFHTLPTSDDVVITATNAIDAIIEIQDDVGEITSLGTTDKSDVVSSINELETAVRGTTANYALNTTSNDLIGASNEHEADIGNMTLTGLTATDISAALRELRTELGNHASLGTTYTTDAVGAINELETAVRGTTANYTIGTNANDLVGAINEIETVLRAGNSDYALTTSAQNVRDAIREHETDIGNMTFTGLAAADISAAIRELRTELGDHSTINDATGYSATSASAGIVELQGDVGNVDSLTTSATKVVLAINELDLKQGSATLGTTATTLSGAVNEFETALRGTQTNYTLTTNASNFRDAVNELELGIRGTSNNLVATDLTTVSNDLVGAINEHETQINTLDTNHLNRNLAAGVNQDVNGSITFKGDSVDFSNTTALFSSAGGVANFGSAFVNLNATAASGSNVNIQGLQVDRTALSGSNPKHDVRLIWNETLVGSKPARAWQLRGMADDKSDNTADIVTFYNAEDLVANNTESGIAVTWDSTNQNFDFNVADPTLTFTSSTFRSSGNLGSATITNLGNTTFALTANTLDLGYSENIRLGGSDEFQIFNDNTNSVISSTDNLHVRTNTYRLNNAANSENMITADANGAVNLFHNGNSKLQTTSVGVVVTGEMEASSLDINGSADISSNLVTHGNLTVNGNTTLGNASSDTVSVPGNLTITGDLTVNGTNTILNTATLEVEDTLILTGTSSTEPTTGGFGIETRSFTGVGTHAGNASNVTGSHSFVYNFAQDRWEADGNMILDTVNSIIIPQVKINSGTPINMTAARDLNLIQGAGITLSGGLSGNDINFTITHDRLAPNENIFKNITANSGGTATANSNNDTLTISGGTALASARSGDTITINHSNVAGAVGTTGQAGAEDGTYLKSITVNAQGHVTEVTSDDFDDRYVQESETTTANTADTVVRRDSNRHVFATEFNGALDGNATTATTLQNTRSIGGTNFNGSANINIAEITVTEDNSDTTFRRLIFHKGDGTGTKELFHDDSLLYRASDNVLSAGTFSGALSGNATSATKVFVNEYNSTTTMRVLGSHDGIDSNGNVYSNAGIYMNMSTDTVYATTFNGNLTGTADNVTNQANSATITADVSANANTIVRRDGSGYLFGNYFNMTANDVSSGVTKVAVETGNDNYLRWGTAAAIRTFLNVSSGSNNYSHPNHSGDVTSAGDGATTIASNVVSNTKLADMAANTIKGRISSAGDPQDLSAANVRSILNVANGANNYSFPYSVNTGNSANSIVYRDASGNFYAGTITASLAGNASTASGANQVKVWHSNTINSEYNLIFSGVSGTDGAQTTMRADRSGGGTYNPYYNRFTATTFSGALSGNASSASVASTVSINYNNNSNSTYQMLWGSGNYVYGTAGIYCNPSTNTIYASGDVVAAASDDRLKDKKGNIENALEKVNALNGFHYNWNDKAVELGFKTEEQKEEDLIGLSAQDVKEVAPELVTESSLEGYDTVRYDKVTALLVEAVKELTEQNKELKAEIESLKSINS